MLRLNTFTPFSIFSLVHIGIHLKDFFLQHSSLLISIAIRSSAKRSNRAIKWTQGEKINTAQSEDRDSQAYDS